MTGNSAQDSAQPLPPAQDLAQRQQLTALAQKLVSLGLSHGTSGNCSLRQAEASGFLITPSGLPAEALLPERMVYMDLAGQHSATQNPSSEWRFHRDLYLARPDAAAIIHVHSTYATTLACLRRDLPPFHYMIAVAGGDSIRCAPYALFGSQALSDLVLVALHERQACLLANHGLIALGQSLEQALALTIEVESLCQQYLLALQAGEPCLLSAAEMSEVLARFKSYGRQAAGL
ncbi:MAG: class II aldolase/adducin family protein [Pseudomonadota bacterium]